MRSVVPLVASALWLAACPLPPTEVTVFVDTDLRSAPDVKLEAFVHRGDVTIPPGDTPDYTRGGGDAGVTFPQHFVITPRPQDPRDESVTLLVQVSAHGTTLRRVVRFQFVPRTPQTLRIFLPLACAALDSTPGHTCAGAPCSRQAYCESIHETCGDDGMCVNPVPPGIGQDVTDLPIPTTDVTDAVDVPVMDVPVMDVPPPPVDTCTPLTCTGRCGAIGDGCGGTLTCGGCPPSYVCDGTGVCSCVAPVCSPGQCGTLANACTSTNCPGCPADFACAGNSCTCSPAANGVCTPGCSNICNDPDCGNHCGNGVCDCDETAATCQDCVCQLRCCDRMDINVNLMPGGHDCNWYALTAGGNACGADNGAFRWHPQNYAFCSVRATGCPGCPSNPGESCPAFEFCHPPDASLCTSFSCPCLPASCCNVTGQPIISSSCFR